MAESPLEPSEDNNVELDATGEFFSVGTPLHAVRAGYIRRRADDLLYEAAIAGRYAHIIAPDRSGKSSLISATAARLEGNAIRVAVLDLGQIGVREGAKDAGRWYYNVAYRLLRQLRIRFDLQEWWQDKSVLSNRQRLLEFYAEVILENVQQSIVIFVDEIQCIANLPFADQLLASVRSAHNARTTDPDFTRLTFVLLGECDPQSLIDEPESSPFSATQAVPLDDFSRNDLNLFSTEMNLDADSAQLALDRIYHWTRGQPYLTQKLARAIARETIKGDLVSQVDGIAGQQLTGRAALHSEPHLSHLHRELVNSGKLTEGLLNLYGKLRKGIKVPADLGSAEQRRLMAVGLLIVDESGELKIRNRIYEAVFTTRWANENLPTRWRVPLTVAAGLAIIAIIPFWYTQWLPDPYVAQLTSAETDFGIAESTWRNLRSFPGHSDAADKLYRTYLADRAGRARSSQEIETISSMAAALPDAGMLPQALLADYWDRQAMQAIRGQQRDDALIASLQALTVSTPIRRNRSAMLVGNDYPLLIASTPFGAERQVVFNPGSLLLTAASGSIISQWALAQEGLSQRDDWMITALEVTPLVRRVIVDSEGIVRRAGLTLNVSHPRMKDLRIKVIAPSGKTVEIEPGVERVSSNEDIRIPASQLRPLLGEPTLGTWSISLRDEATGVAGHLVGWNLTLNSQGLVEDFERGIGIPDPVEKETDQFWINSNGRYAVARATQSDSVRLWDLAFAKPIAAVAVSENENLIGLDEGARHLITATLDTVNLWNTVSGARAATLPVGPASGTSRLTADGKHLFVQNRSDIETRFQLWSLDTASMVAEIVVAGAPALAVIDAAGSRLAVADYDRAIRIWDFHSAQMLVQLDLPMQPSDIRLSAGGRVISAVYGTEGVSVWRADSTEFPMFESFGKGAWQIAFSPSGARFAAGHPRNGFQLYESLTGRRVGPAVGAGGNRSSGNLLGFSRDEDVIVTSGPTGNMRFWQFPISSGATSDDESGHAVWSASGDAIAVALASASTIAVGDRHGHVHLIAANSSDEAIVAEPEEVSFIGHSDRIRLLAASRDGGRLASVAADNTIRVWRADTGLPESFIRNFSGTRIERIGFSANAGLLGVLAADRVAIMDTSSGEIVAEIELGESHT
ncbi:MAG: AAA-like domain-containing protein, partial [Gammaproteobacteria bacterium]|nr:AAA-like domain-containing protein [Gammaproteobacteria bacterium]